MPLEYRFPESVREVFIRREGESVILTPRPTDWSGFFATGMKASADFMAENERLPIQERQMTEKGRKQETFDYGRIGCDQRSMAFALRMDRKR